jgi:hypothetical protein
LRTEHLVRAEAYPSPAETADLQAPFPVEASSDPRPGRLLSASALDEIVAVLIDAGERLAKKAR